MLGYPRSLPRVSMSVGTLIPALLFPTADLADWLRAHLDHQSTDAAG